MLAGEYQAVKECEDINFEIVILQYANNETHI